MFMKKVDAKYFATNLAKVWKKEHYKNKKWDSAESKDTYNKLSLISRALRPKIRQLEAVLGHSDFTTFTCVSCGHVQRTGVAVKSLGIICRECIDRLNKLGRSR